jgi:hypothetical protein
MAEHIWSVLCTKVVTDKDTNSISLLEVIDGIKVLVRKPWPAKEIHMMPFALDLMSLFQRSAPSRGEKTVSKLKITAPDGRVLTENELAIDLSTAVRFRANMRATQFALTGEGTYHFVVYLKKNRKWSKVASIPLDVTIEVQPEP